MFGKGGIPDAMDNERGDSHCFHVPLESFLKALASHCGKQNAVQHEFWV